MMKMTNLEAIAVLEDMKVKIYIPRAAVTQKKRNEALEMAIRSLANDERVDAIMNEVCKKISVPVSSDYPILPKVVLEETLRLGKPGDVEIPKTHFPIDPYAVCKFNEGGQENGNG